MTRPNRPDLHSWFLSLASTAAERGTCLRAKVGCVLARGNRFLVLGYVGSPAGEPHCLDEGCVIGPSGGCVRTRHAEANALQWARDLKVNVCGATAYCTLSPCRECYQKLRAAGVDRIYYRDRYRNADHLHPDIAIQLA